MVATLRRGLIPLIFFLLFAFRFTLSAESVELSRPIRVAVVQDEASLLLKADGAYQLLDGATLKIIGRGANIKATVAADNNGIRLGQKNYAVRKLLLKTSAADPIYIGDRSFSGDIEFIRKNNGNFAAVNHINIEDYIKGILYHEASHYWPPEALKAQAIACRSYAVYQMRQNRNNDFDVTSDIYSQVYGGKISERYRTNEAVEQTAGLILRYKGNLFPAYYHATCAGHTEDASRLWDIDIVPLKGVVCDYCRESPHYSWHQEIAKKDAQWLLIKAGYSVAGMIDIKVSGTNPSGRITDLLIITKDRRVKVSGKDFRNILGPNVIRSNRYNISVVKENVIVDGTGWAHGVGMCQWGAYFMAKEGVTAEQILLYYYPGAEITHI